MLALDPTIPAFAGLAQVRSEGILEGLIQLLFIAVFFGIPILRGIFSERSKQAAGRRPAPPKPRPRPERGAERGEERGGDLWRQLLEGIEEPEAKTPVPRPQDPMGDPQVRPESTVRRAPSRRRPEPIEAELEPTPEPVRPQRRRPAPLQVDLPSRDDDGKLRADLPSAGRSVPTESELEVSGGDDRLPRRVLTELDGLAERTPVSASLGTEPLESAAPTASVAPSRVLSPLASAPEDWRRAVVLAEILAPPIALREPDDGLGPAGLR